MTISILSPDAVIFEGEIKAVIVPGVTGTFEILNQHAPIVSALTSGKVKVTMDNGELMTFKIEKGFLEMLANKVSLLVEGYEA